MNQQLLYALLTVLLCMFGLGLLAATPKLKQLYSDLLILQRKFTELKRKYSLQKQEVKTLRKARKKG